MTYEGILAIVLEEEGGWYDGSESRDPNPTMRGVTQKTYDKFGLLHRWPLQSVRHITDAQLAIVYRDYWTRINGDLVLRANPNFALILFDLSINSGPRRAVRFLQGVLRLKRDGIIGPKTERAIVALRFDKAAIHRLLLVRMEWYTNVSRSLRLRQNLYGWMRRLVNISHKAGAI